MLNHTTRKILLIACFTSTSMLTFATSIPALESSLQTSRYQAVKTYLENLQIADPSQMVNLFDESSVVYSTSQGRKSAILFFNTILPELAASHPKVKIFSIHKNDYLPNTYAASFRLTWQGESGKEQGGYFIDTFKFSSNQKTPMIIEEVDMFEGFTETE